MKVIVCFARANGQYIERPVVVEKQCSVRWAIERSGILQACDEINLSENKVGVFGRLVTLEAWLSEGDRVEIYRGLKVDPKAARLKRAAKS
ncbi:MAG: hypothetical protein A3F17_03020 [Gammaproteobacteria bacterium RIFCSPHIGHO2_12_FULL_41_15]|nr:MAG: hypothetical protein A3F17_03020 [Gammaproteobacteria bacterium RIFCSPHIGHO2_12_FULL_41_15]